jgi:putative transposase
MNAVANAGAEIGISAACDALGVPRASFYRWRAPVHGPHPKKASPRALAASERAAVLGVLHEDRFVDQAPAEVYATLLDEGRYIASISTMYRILHDHDEVRERRKQTRHASYTAPELLAVKPNQVWSWDITKLKGPEKWSYFHLYVILDIFSRYIVGWMVAHRESAVLAEKLIATTCERQGIQRDQLTLHADRGSSMKSKPVAFLLADLGVTKTHSRPHVSNDNPYSEANFKTLKYRPGFPERFGSIEDARAHAGPFVNWYNNEHHHSGVALLTPRDVHHGLAQVRVDARTQVLRAAQATHPERFVHGLPTASQPPSAVWINPPKATTVDAGAGAPQDRCPPKAGGEPEGHPWEPEAGADDREDEVARGGRYPSLGPGHPRSPSALAGRGGSTAASTTSPTENSTINLDPH